MCPTWASRQEVVLGETPSAFKPSMKELNLVTSLDTCLHLKAIKRTCFDSLLNTNIATSFSPLLDHLHRLLILLPFLGIMRSKPSSAMRLLLCSSVVLTASAGVIRAPPTLEDCQLEIQDKMANDPNRVNTAGTAGIGAEFETPEIYLETTCSAEDTNAAKYKVIAGRKGENWKLTADSLGQEGKLNAEYIIDGNNVKVGSTDDATNGAKVAAAMAKDLVRAVQSIRNVLC